MVSQLSPTCGFPDVVSQSLRCLLVSRLSSRCGLPSCLLDVSQMWFPGCGFLDVVSQLPPMFLQLLSSCLPLVSRMLSPGCCLPFRLLFPYLPPLSHMWSPSCLLGVISQMLSLGPVVMQLSSTSLPDVISQLCPRSGFRDGGSRRVCCLVVFHPSPRSGLSVVSYMWFRRCGLPVELLFSCLPLVSQM